MKSVHQNFFERIYDLWILFLRFKSGGNTAAEVD